MIKKSEYWDVFRGDKSGRYCGEFYHDWLFDNLQYQASIIRCMKSHRDSKSLIRLSIELDACRKIYFEVKATCNDLDLTR